MDHKKESGFPLDIDLRNLNMDVVLSPKLGEARLRRFAFVEMEPQSPDENGALKKDTEFISANEVHLGLRHHHLLSE
jgi:hypothetical protein